MKMKNLPGYRAFCPLLLGLFLLVGCGGPSDDELRPVVLVTLRGISSDITTLRVKALINGAPAMNTQEYQEGLGRADVSEYRFAVRAPVLRAPGRLELSIWSLTADGCFLSENDKESAQVEPAQFQELIIDLHRFEKVMCPLTVQRQGGPGLVHFDPERPICADTCTELFPRDQTVTLVADGNRQTSLQEWEGDCSGQSTCQVKLSGPMQVTARFMQTLRVVPAWSSSEPGVALITSDPAGIACADRCAAGFPDGTQVTLRAKNGPQLCFLGWGGPCSGTETCVVTAGKVQEVTATFASCTVQTTPVSNYISSVWASSEMDIWATADATLLRSDDGKTWKSVPISSSMDSITSVWTSSPQSEVWFSSRARTGADSFLIRLNRAFSSSSTSTYPEQVHAIWGLNGSEVFALGSAGRIGRVDTGSFVLWQSHTSYLYGLHGSSKADIWAVGDSSSILHWDGTAWTQSPLDKSISALLRSVWAISPSRAWAVGNGGVILTWDGVRWTQVNHGLTSKNLSSVWGSSASDVWTVGAGGTILHWDGRVWSRIQSLTAANLNAVHGANEKALWMVGDSSTILKFSR